MHGVTDMGRVIQCPPPQGGVLPLGSWEMGLAGWDVHGLSSRAASPKALDTFDTLATQWNPDKPWRYAAEKSGPSCTR